jgi:hypothetical protein
MMLKPKIFADKIFYFESIIPETEQIIDIIEQTDTQLTEKDVISP